MKREALAMISHDCRDSLVTVCWWGNAKKTRAEADHISVGTKGYFSLNIYPHLPIYTSLVDHVNSFEKQEISACRLPQKRG